MKPLNTLISTGTYRTLVSSFDSCVQKYSDKAAFIFLEASKSSERTVLTYSQLREKALAIAAALQAKQVCQERVLLIYKPGLEFIAAFLGCIYAGAIAVPAYPPRKNHHFERLQGILHNAQAKFVLTTQQGLDTFEPEAKKWSELADATWIASDQLRDQLGSNLSDRWQMPDIAADHLAMLQYTSGSTGVPKGVMIQHDHLLFNSSLIDQCFQHLPNKYSVCWLPPYHDMGLIGGILHPLLVGSSTVLMDPVSFLQRPLRWLQAISQYQASTAGCPNFAYALCADAIQIQDCEGLDLSHWQVAFTGAEPIQAATLRRFAQKFAPFGFAETAFLPCYGMAEATLMVTGERRSAGTRIKQVDTQALRSNRIVTASVDAGTTELVSCGAPVGTVQVQIVNPETRQPCPPGEIGEVWVVSESVAAGYWQQPELTQAIFAATLAGNPEQSWLRTGDLGFLNAGDLFITGRLKELMIIRGRNYYPQDIEQSIQASHSALRSNYGAAFTVTQPSVETSASSEKSGEKSGEETLVIVQEVERTALRQLDVEAVLKAIRRAIADQFDLQVGAIVLLKPAQLPKTTSGKVQRLRCREKFLAQELEPLFCWSSLMLPEAGKAISSGMPSLNPTATAQVNPAPNSWDGADWQHQIQTWLLHQVSEYLHLLPDQIKIQEPLADYGLSSLTAARLSGDLQEWLKIPLDPTLLYDYPSIAELATELAQRKGNESPKFIPTQPSSVQQRRRQSDGDIAVIGMGCRFPGANSLEAYWQLLVNQVDAIQEVPPERWDVNAYYDPNPSAIDKMQTRWGGFIETVDQFDAPFFRISPREASSMDPQQRLLLEVTWEAIEQAGIAPQSLAGSQTGVFIGISSNDYARLIQKQQLRPDAYSGTSHALSIAANRLSYLMDWQGPSMAIDTACSSSLVAIHQACQSLRQGDCQLAIAGGVNLILDPDLTITFSQAQMMAADGRCKTFDAKADGYVRGEGCGVVLLKSLDAALRDGDVIYGVVKGSAINQDGRSNGLTAPNSQAQQSVIRKALVAANLSPSQISYVEAHGTGTALGDPIEVNALKAVFGSERPLDQPLGIGSVKTNIGHLEAAAGIASFIKVMLSLHHKTRMATLHCSVLNPLIDLTHSPLYVAIEGYPWEKQDQPRYKGISAFGFGGTNAHVIVAEAPAQKPSVPKADRPYHLLTLSAKTQSALAAQVAQYHNFLADHPEVSLANLCFTANTGRSTFEWRTHFVVPSREVLQHQFATVDPEQFSKAASHRADAGKCAFLFTGQGCQYPGMGQQLYQTQPVFRAVLTRCAEILVPLVDIPLLELLYPALYPSDRSPDCIDQTRYAQPALFVVEYALAQLWQSWGIRPTAVMGHSLGEYVAACVAGVFSLEDGLKLVAHRARLMQALPSNGAMVAVLADEAAIALALAPYATQVSIAAFNGSKNLVISGMEQAVDCVVQTLESQGITTKRLVVSHGFHSALMEPMLADFERVAQEITYFKPQIDLISNLTGTQIGTEAIAADYWVRHIRQPVRFTQGMTTLLKQGYNIFLEMGAKPILLGMAQRMDDATQSVSQDKRSWLPSLRAEEENWQTLLSSLGQLFVRGVEIDWLSFDQPYGYHRLTGLPTYPFQRQRYWFSDNLAPISAPIQASIQPCVQAPNQAPMQISPFLQSRHLDRRSQILALLQDQVGKSLVGAGIGVDPQASFLELGADSINLFETIQIVDKTFGIKVSVRQFFEELSTLEALATYLDQSLSPAWEPPAAMLPAIASSPAAVSTLVSTLSPHASQNFNEVFVKVDQLQHHLSASERTTPLVRVIQDQLAVLQTVMTQQLSALQNETLSGVGGYSAPAQPELPRPERVLSAPAPAPYAPALPSPAQISPPAIGSLQIPRADRTQPLPLSFAQQRLWFLNQLEGSSAAYNLPFALRLIGQLKFSVLEQAFATLSERHESLRTTFCRSSAQANTQAGTQDIQIIHPPAAISIEQVDLQALDETAQAQAVQHHSQQEAQYCFDLETGSLLRVLLLRLKSDEHILLVTMHHIVSDGWSMTVFAREIILLYQTYANAQPLRMPPMLTQYADYAVWQQQWLRGAVLQEKLDYWQHQLSGTLPVLDLPTDRPRPAVRSGQGKTLRWQISEALTQDLQRLSQQEGVTLFMLLLAAFKTLLHRYTGQTDVLVGTPIANRNQAEVKGLIGFFVNTLVLRTDLSGELSFRSLLSRVREVTLDAYAHQELPFEKLVEALQPERSLSYTPLFQVMFVLQNVPMQTLNLPGLQVERIEVESGAAQFDLTLELTETEQGLQAALSYSTDLFEAATLTRLQGHFQSLLESIVIDPTQPLAQLPLLPNADRQQIIYDWNATAVEFTAPFLLHGGFEAQVQQTPHAIALIHEAQTLTYRELNDRANQFAHHLHQQGVTTDVLVGVYVERSPEMVIGVLAILKAGGAYVPLDPTYPAERIADMIADAQVPIILAQTHLVEKLPDHAAQVICLDQPATIASYPTTNLDRVLSPDQLAYVIYTSGSTGKPKGVMISHRGAVNTNLDINQRFRIGSDDRVIGLASLSFDLSVYDIFGFLAAGGAIVIPHAQDALNPTRWLQLMHQHQVTFWNTAPAVMEMLMASLSRQATALARLLARGDDERRCDFCSPCPSRFAAMPVL